jgi:prolyl-tRNA editing enzyme YbaK/EbsC (Cys-tRNA(Pro) deacylase)
MLDTHLSGEMPAGEDPANAPEATRRVLETLTRAGVDFTLRLFEPGSYTPEDMAALCGCEVNFIVKITVLRGKASKKPHLFMHSAAIKLNERAIGAMVGENLHRADPDFSHRLTGYPANAIPPVGHMTRTPVLMDGMLMRLPRIWCPAGVSHAMVALPTMILARALAARIIRIE